MTGEASMSAADLTPRLVRAAAEAVIAQADALTTLDQAIGDGDHGFNMKRGMEAVVAELPKLAGKPPGDMLKACGMVLVMKVGGASGPLFGTLVMELGKALPADFTRAGLSSALETAIAAVKARGKSELGQKTMLDVLGPVRDALASGAPPSGIARAADAAAQATAPLRASRGRASFLGERSVGHVDPGARSTALIVAAICTSLER